MDIIIPTWNNSDLTIQCLLALKKGTQPGYRIIWIDDGSEPEHLQAVREWLRIQGQKYEAHFFDENAGFPKAINRGLIMATGEFVILLNNDVQVTPGWLEKLTGWATTHPKIGILGCLTDTGRIQKYTRYFGERPDPAGFINRLEPTVVQITASCVPFSCVLLRREMIPRVGLLDLDFSPCLGEDDDYCDRARLAGWQTAILLNLFVYHRHRQSVAKIPDWEKLQAEHIALYLRKKAARRIRR